MLDKQIRHLVPELVSVAIVIPTYNRKKYLQAVLYQILNQKINGFNLFIIVVVDGSTDGTIEMLHNDFPNVYIVKGTGNLWYTKSMNEGFRKALIFKPDYLLCLNDDIYIETTYIADLLEQAISCLEPVVIGSVTVSFHPPHRVLFAGVRRIKWLFYSYTNYEDLDKPYLAKSQPFLVSTIVLPGRGMLIDRRVMDKIGLFDEALIQYGSDDEYTLRTRKNGFSVWLCRKAVIYSHERLTGKGSVHNLPSLPAYLRSLFVKTSPNSLHKSFYLINKYGISWLRPLTYCWILFGSLYIYFKYWFKKGV